MRKLALSLIVLAGCSSAPVETPVVPNALTSTPQGHGDTESVPEIPESPETGLGATSTSAPPSVAPRSTTTVFVPARPAQASGLSVSTTVPRVTSGSTLRNCIAYYESTNGALDSNLYQFVPSTWRAYGGTGNPEDASVAEQNAVFERAWTDGGEHHWAAQKGRCF